MTQRTPGGHTRTVDDTWASVDAYVGGLVIGQDEALRTALESAEAAGLPPISVSAAQGKFLHLLARVRGARRILEIGTLAGYSTIWLGRALPADGRLITIEADAAHASIARANIDRAGLRTIVDVRLGRALDVLPAIEAEGIGPFDLTFIDADKVSTADYFSWALRLSIAGSLIVVDNVVRGGAVADASSGDSAVQGMRRFFAQAAAEPRVSMTALQTVGVKGYDGFALALVTS
jgi:predicted O-methyltransferase YrrM